MATLLSTGVVIPYTRASFRPKLHIALLLAHCYWPSLVLSPTSYSCSMQILLNLSDLWVVYRRWHWHSWHLHCEYPETSITTTIKPVSEETNDAAHGPNPKEAGSQSSHHNPPHHLNNRLSGCQSGRGWNRWRNEHSQNENVGLQLCTVQLNFYIILPTIYAEYLLRCSKR